MAAVIEDAVDRGEEVSGEGDRTRRREFLGVASSVAMAGGLAASYGTLAVMAGRFLYPPSGGSTSAWVYLADLKGVKAGDSFIYRAPSGATVAVARIAAAGEAADFLALSSVCPHLGCQVHWQSQHRRFFCPCHNGTFDASGKATGGPPADAGQSLPRFPLKVEDGLLYIEVPIESVASGSPAARAGHDPCPESAAGRSVC